MNSTFLMSFYSKHKTFSFFYSLLYYKCVTAVCPHLPDKHHRVENGFISLTHALINDNNITFIIILKV